MFYSSAAQLFQDDPREFYFFERIRKLEQINAVFGGVSAAFGAGFPRDPVDESGESDVHQRGKILFFCWLVLVLICMHMHSTCLLLVYMDRKYVRLAFACFNFRR